jgi:hypothetical protein
MKEWPADEKPAYFEDITAPIIRAIKFAYALRRKNRGKSIPYNGLDIGKDSQATCLRAKEQLSAEQLAYSSDEQGRNALEEIIGLAVRLGIEQGRRITLEGHEMRMVLLRAGGADMRPLTRAESLAAFSGDWRWALKD